MVAGSASRRQLVAAIRAEITQATARRYQISLDSLDAASLWELLRLLRDLEAAKRTAVRLAKRTRWRR